MLSMEKTIFLKSAVDAYFLVNGKFVKNGGSITLSGGTAFVTVFPTHGALIPYSVRIEDGEVEENCLVRVVTVKEDCDIAVFDKRYECVFSPETVRDYCFGEGLIQQFFKLIKNGDLTKARAFLTPDLSKSVDDEALKGFFDDYDLVLSSDFVTGKTGSYLFVRPDGTAKPHRVSFLGELIDDVSEE